MLKDKSKLCLLAFLSIFVMLMLSFGSQYVHSLYGLPVMFAGLSKESIVSVFKRSQRCALPSCRKRVSRGNLDLVIIKNNKRLYFCSSEHLEFYQNPQLIELAKSARRNFLRGATLAGVGVAAFAALSGLGVGPVMATPSQSQVGVYSQFTNETPYIVVFTDGTNYYTKNSDTGLVTEQTATATGGIQEAANTMPNTGGIIFVMRGIYYVSTPAGINLQPDAKGIWLQGVGMDWVDYSTGSIIQATVPMTTLLNMNEQFDRVSNMMIDGNGYATTCINMNTEDTFLDWNLVRAPASGGTHLDMSSTNIGVNYDRVVAFNEFDTGVDNGIGIKVCSPVPYQGCTRIFCNKFGLEATNNSVIYLVNGCEGVVIMNNLSGSETVFLEVPSGATVRGIQCIGNNFAEQATCVYYVAGTLTDSVIIGDFLDGNNITPNFMQTIAGSTISNVLVLGCSVRALTGLMFSLAGAGIPTAIANQGYNPQGFAASTPTVPASTQAATNMNPYAVRLIILTATGATATITDPNGITGTSFPLTPGNFVILDPGAKITPTYSTLTWQPYGV